jgi:spermidine synthase
MQVIRGPRRLIQFRDRLGDGTTREIEGVLRYVNVTELQSVRVLDSSEYGTMLILDDELQLATSDQEIYHRYLVRPGLDVLANALGSPKGVLILGGADGFSLDIVAQSAHVGAITLVDHDKELVKLFAGGPLGKIFNTASAFADARVELQYQDAFQYVLNLSERLYDFIIIDLTDDWIECENAARMLHSLSEGHNERLLISMNAGTNADAVDVVRGSGLEIIALWSIPIPSFGEPWWCVLAAPKGQSQTFHLDVAWRTNHLVI